MNSEVRLRDRDKRRMNDAGDVSPPHLAEVMRRITEEIREEIVETIRESRNDSVRSHPSR
jgi:hypothetical protein